jgi:hypothetical protein
MARRAVYSICESIGYVLCELAFRTDCRGPFALAYRAGCWFYLKSAEIAPPSDCTLAQN